MRGRIFLGELSLNKTVLVWNKTPQARVSRHVLVGGKLVWTGRTPCFIGQHLCVLIQEHPPNRHLSPSFRLGNVLSQKCDAIAGELYLGRPQYCPTCIGGTVFGAVLYCAYWYASMFFVFLYCIIAGARCDKLRRRITT